MQVYDLYTITSQSTLDDEHIFRVQINPQHPLFAGHFPSQPVLPGVCTLAIVRACLSLCVGLSIRFSEIRECKFVSVVDPRVTSEIEVCFTALGGEVRGVVANQGQAVLKLKAKYTPTNA